MKLIANQIRDRLILETTTTENNRVPGDYIGLSRIGACSRQIVTEYFGGREMSEAELLKRHNNYRVELDIKKRLMDQFGDDVKFGAYVSGYNGLVKGHPHFWFCGMPGYIKSVVLDKWLPQKRLPRRVQYQMQGYMHYSQTALALVIYESRESGRIEVYCVEMDREMGDEIDRKVAYLIDCVNERRIPECDCGRCKNG